VQQAKIPYSLKSGVGRGVLHPRRCFFTCAGRESRPRNIFSSVLARFRDGHFIFLWIAFNAAYATDLDEKYRTSERTVFREFLQKLITLDRRGAIQQLVWEQFSGSIRLLLDNKFIYQDFFGILETAN